MNMEALKKIGILGVTFGLAASPLAFADDHGEMEGQDPTHEETMMDEDANMNTLDDNDDEWEEGGGEEEGPM